ncbi:MAG: serine hydrolase [Gemmatimonadetes bacterium]|nr:serine hydrolase [Gemmatimonadota bacterium]
MPGASGIRATRCATCTAPRHRLPPVPGGTTPTPTAWLLARVLERITGKPIDDEIRRRFLVPMKLTNTLPSDSRTLPGVVQGYAGAQNPFGGRDAMLDGGVMIVNPQFEGAGGGYAASAADAFPLGQQRISAARFTATRCSRGRRVARRRGCSVRARTTASA